MFKYLHVIQAHGAKMDWKGVGQDQKKKLLIIWT